MTVEGPYASEFTIVKSESFVAVVDDCLDLHMVASQSCLITVQYTPPSGSWSGYRIATRR